MKKETSAKQQPAASNAPAPGGQPGKVAPLTKKEVWIAVLVAYLKITLPLNAFVWVYHHVKDGLLQVILLGVIGLVGITLFSSLGKDFVIRLRGQLKPRQFIWMYLVSVGMILLAGAFLFSGMESTPSAVVKVLLTPIAIQYEQEDVALFCLIFLLLALMWLIDTIMAHRQRCEDCGGYGHRETIEVPGTSQYGQVGELTTVTTEVERVRIDRYGIEEDFRETTSNTKTIAYTEVKCTRCRYCGKVYKVFRDSGTFNEEKHDTRYYTERH